MTNPLFVASFFNTGEFEDPFIKFIKSRASSITTLTLAPSTSLKIGDQKIDNTSDQPLEVPLDEIHSVKLPQVFVSSKPFKEKDELQGVNHLVDDNPLEAFRSALKSLPKDTKTLDIVLAGHGGAYGTKHFIGFDTKQGYVDVDSMVASEVLFKLISKALPDTEVNVVMISCFGGLAQAHKDSLPKGSVLHTISSDSTFEVGNPALYALEHYPTDKPFSSVTFIELLLARGQSSYGSSVVSGLTQHLADRIMKGVAQDGNPSHKYLFSPSLSDETKANFPSMIDRFSQAVQDESNVSGFLETMARFSKHPKKSGTDRFLEYDNFLSLLAVQNATGETYTPSTDFVAPCEDATLNVDFAGWSRLFHGNGRSYHDRAGPLSIFDFVGGLSHYNLGKDADSSLKVKNDNLVKYITSGVPNPGAYTQVKIACHFLPDPHTGSPAFVVVFISEQPQKELAIGIFEMPKEKLLELLSGKVTSFYDFAVEMMKKDDDDKDTVDMMLQNINIHIREEFSDWMEHLKSMKDKVMGKLDKSADKFGQMVCRKIDECIAEMVKSNKLASSTFASYQDLLEAIATAHSESKDKLLEVYDCANSAIYDPSTGDFVVEAIGDAI